MLPSRPRPPWSTSRPRLWRAPGPWSGSRASNSPSLTSPRRVLTTPQSPLRALASFIRAQAAEAIAGAHAGSGGVRLEPPGTEEEGQADQGQILAAGITWWSRSATEGWMSSHSCKFSTLYIGIWTCWMNVSLISGTACMTPWLYIYPAKLISIFLFQRNSPASLLGTQMYCSLIQQYCNESYGLSISRPFKRVPTPAVNIQRGSFPPKNNS